MLWQGPKSGISQSMMNDFYICRFRFYLKYILGLDSEMSHPNTIWGDILHKGLEHYIQSKDYEFAALQMHKYMFDRYPAQLGTSVLYTTKLMLKLYKISQFEGIDDIQTEVILAETIVHNNYEYLLRGKIDVLLPDKVIDHKCKGAFDAEEVRSELKTDLQLNFYAKLAGVTNFGYDLIRIPEADWKLPERKPGQSLENYANMLFFGNSSTFSDYPIAPKHHRWLQYLHIPSSQEEIEEVWAKTVYPTLSAMREYYEYVSDPSFNWENPACFNSTFYQTPVRHFNPMLTDKFKGEFHDLLIGKKTLDDYPRKTTCFPELEENG